MINAAAMKIKGKPKRISKEGFYGTLFAAIPLAGILFFTLIPAAVSLATVFFDMRGSSFDTMTWNNFANFETVFTDTQFYHSLLINLYATVGSMISLVIAVIMAALVTAKLPARRFFKVLFFLPYICSTIATSVMFKWLFNTNYGVINDALINMFGESARINFMGDKNWFMPMLLVVMVWNYPGYGIVFIGAALMAVNRNYYEAAQIDGAGPFRRF
ncbi:MAG: sugar ABC transporter permease, partial [Clostridiales bacterium]|nr:sugar ABC transporter permease [Clostridiales bacterium]